MPKRRKKPIEEYEFVGIMITGYEARIDASINYEVRDKRHYYRDAKVYKFGSSVVLEGVCSYPEEREGEKYSFTVYGGEAQEGEFDARLSDCHVHDEDGTPKYRRVRGEDIPVYEVPQGIGSIERVRGTGDWSGWCWISPRAVSDMLALLPNASPLYISLHERRIGRNRWINGLTLQTTDPAEE